MTRIIVKNGDWDKARADLGTVLDSNRAKFDAQFEAAFGARKPAASEPAATKASAPTSAAPLILSRSSRR